MRHLDVWLVFPDKLKESDVFVSLCQEVQEEGTLSLRNVGNQIQRIRRSPEDLISQHY